MLQEAEIQELIQKLKLLEAEIHKIIVGQDDVVRQMLICLMAGGHALLEGVPGLAKTLMVRTLAEALHLSFRRIQFTPDLMPADIVGTEILQEDPQTGKRHFQFIKGAIFANIVLADEINRTPPKTQAALLEAMQEKSITYSGKTYKLEKPFLILATQNPLEQAGTYALPEAQADRFLLLIKVPYPTENEEFQVLKNTTSNTYTKIETIMNADEILKIQKLVRQLPVSDSLIRYVTHLVRATRPADSDIDIVRNWVEWGAGTRAGQALLLTAKAHALISGRYAVTPEDLQKMALPVFRHRILLNFRAESQKITTDQLSAELFKKVPLPDAKW